jgi:hypothetical protein
LLTVLGRRYRCRHCDAVLLVVPVTVAPRRLFDLATIALALARWVVDGRPSHRVRAEVSPLLRTGLSGRRSWHQLRRWARDIRTLFRPPRPIAGGARAAVVALVLETVAEAAPLSMASAPLAERVFRALCLMPSMP